VTNAVSENDRINLRLKQASKHLIERAASFEGKTVSNFVLSSALASAEHTIRQHQTLILDQRDAQRFFDALDRPPVFNDALSKALMEHERRVDSQ